MQVNESELREITRLVEEGNQGFLEFKGRYDGRVKQLEKEVTEIAKKVNRPNIGGGSTAFGAPTEPPKHAGWIDTKTGEPLVVLSREDSLARHVERTSADGPSFGRVLRGILAGGQAPDARELANERKELGLNPDPSGGYTVAGVLAAEWIDALRAQMVLQQAGCTTIPMESGEVGIVKVLTDPECGWHAENGSMPLSSPTFGKLTLRAKTVACVVRLSVELAQDCVDIENKLASVITKAMAGEIDRCGLNGVDPASTGAGGASAGLAAGPVGIFDLADRNTVTSIGAPTSWDFVVDGLYELMADNVPAGDIGALIGHPAIWKKMGKLKSGISSDNTPLMAPQEVQALPKLWTTAAPVSGGTAKAIIANWADLVFGIRKGLTIRVLDQSRVMADALQFTVLAYARVDFCAARPQSFCTLEGITV